MVIGDQTREVFHISVAGMDKDIAMEMTIPENNMPHQEQVAQEEELMVVIEEMMEDMVLL